MTGILEDLHFACYKPIMALFHDPCDDGNIENFKKATLEIVGNLLDFVSLDREDFKVAYRQVFNMAQINIPVNIGVLIWGSISCGINNVGPAVLYQTIKNLLDSGWTQDSEPDLEQLWKRINCDLRYLFFARQLTEYRQRENLYDIVDVSHEIRSECVERLLATLREENWLLEHNPEGHAKHVILDLFEGQFSDKHGFDILLDLIQQVEDTVPGEFEKCQVPYHNISPESRKGLIEKKMNKLRVRFHRIRLDRSRLPEHPGLKFKEKIHKLRTPLPYFTKNTRIIIPQCTLCEEQHDSWAEVKEHRRSLTGIPSIYRIDEQDMYEDLSIHDITMGVCPVCNQQFSNQSTFSDHIWTPGPCYSGVNYKNQIKIKACRKKYVADLAAYEAKQQEIDEDFQRERQKIYSIFSL